MAASLITPPVAEPVSLPQLKAHLRIETDAEDTLLARLITAARGHIETLTGRVLMAQGWRVYLDRWPTSRMVPLPLSPVRAVSAVTVYDAAGNPHVLPASDYTVALDRFPPVLVIGQGASAPAKALNGIEIDIEAGYASADAVPPAMREAVLRLAAFWFEHRLDEAAVNMAPVPAHIEGLVAPYRQVRL